MEWSGRSLLPVFGPLEPHEITRDLVAEYISSSNKAPGTIWTEINHLRMTLNWAVREGIIKGFPPFPLPSRPPPRTDYLTKDQVNALLSAATLPHLALFIVLAATTGARNRAILELTWDRVDLTRRLIVLNTEDMENKKPRAVIPINELLFRHLTQASLVRLASCNHVIEYHGRPIASVKKALKALSRTTGVHPVSPHIFRHSAAVWMAEAGVSMEEIAQFLGHRDIEITRSVYARFSPSYLRKAASALEL